MAELIILKVPEDISVRARQDCGDSCAACRTAFTQPSEDARSAAPSLAARYAGRTRCLHHLSDDALWTIAREQMPEDVQARAHALMDKNSPSIMADEEHGELEHLVERGDRLMLRKAEAAALLRKRGYTFTQKTSRRSKRWGGRWLSSPANSVAEGGDGL